MIDVGRVVTTKLSAELIGRLDEVANRVDRSKSWIVRQAIDEWLSDEERRFELAVEATSDIDHGHVPV
ncbi:MAG TPA: ribbon-helix-helix domain-containing protein [Sphingomicrobium sp.]|jgi:predicted transcriptional regulator|nr:ribbon-helix-helix domain-containing protein [Sphingomicrobium sp.]